MAQQSDQELLAMFKSPDDWTTEALDFAKAELRKRGLEGPGEPPPVIPERREDQPDIYEYFGTYSNEDARLLLDTFIGAEIDYTLDVDKMGLANMSPFRASIGGRFGMGVGIAIGVHTNDCDRAMEIRQHVLKIIP
jgi:hypothetical protein